MNEITRNQLAAMTLITDAFVLFCFSEKISLVTAGVFVAASLFQLLLAIPLAELGGISEKWAETVYLLYILLWGGLLFVMQWNTSKAIYIPYENSGGVWGKLLISGLIFAVCLYISSTGVKSLARAALISAFIGAVCLLVVSVSALMHVDPENLSRARSGRSVTEEIISGFAMSGSIGSFAIMLKLSKGSAMKNTSFYFIAKTILTGVVMLTAVVVAGGIMNTTYFPIVTAAQISQPFSSQRIDSLFLIVFTIFAVFSIAVQTTAAAYLLNKLIPRFNKFRSSAALLLMIGSAFMLSNIERYGAISGAATAVVLFVLPLASLTAKKLSHKKEPERRASQC